MAAPPKTQQSDEDIFAVFCIASVLAVIFLWIWPAIWMYRDAKRRMNEAALWLIIGLVAPIIGPIIWLIVRSDPGPPPQPAYYYPTPAPYYYPPPQYPQPQYPQPQYPQPQYPPPQQQYDPYERTYYDAVEVVEVDVEEGVTSTRRDPYRRY